MSSDHQILMLILRSFFPLSCSAVVLRCVRHKYGILIVITNVHHLNALIMLLLTEDNICEDLYASVVFIKMLVFT